MRGFSRIAIVNRGEAATRAIHAVRELNAEGRSELKAIAFFTEPDRRAMFVREADEAIDLGPAMGVDPADGTRKLAYLDHRRLREALSAARAEAAWVGWGFVAEQPEFAELCRELGVVFIGPSPEAMRLLGDKIEAKRVAERAGVPVIPWSGGPVESLNDAERAAERIGFPVLVKAAAGGGGRGIRRAERPGDLRRAYEQAVGEARASLESAVVYVERAISGARHVEVQIVGDRSGKVWALGTRDCSVQRRHQKVMEEGPCPVLTADEESAMRQAAVRLAQAVRYENAGTVEFLFEEDTRRFHLLEVNARLQVEHPVTEATTGVDLVKLQLHVAAGGLLAGEPPPARGHAVEVRLCAEDPDLGFAPTPGKVSLFRMPSGPGIRVDRGLGEGDVVPAEFDSMIAKVIAHGGTRREALARLERALAESAILVERGATNRSFLVDLLRRPEVQQGALDTGWLERTHGEARLHPYADVALLRAAIDVAHEQQKVELAQFYLSAARLRPEVRARLGRVVDVRYAGQSYQLAVHHVGPREYLVETGGETLRAEIDPLRPHESWLKVAGRRYRTLCSSEALRHTVEVQGVVHKIHRDDGGLVRASSPAIVVAVAAEAGQIVERGQELATLEAMKMEMSVTSPWAGRIRQVMVKPNTQVGPGAPLLQIDPFEDTADLPTGVRASFQALGLAERAEHEREEPWRRELGAILRSTLGYDVPASLVRRAVTDYGAHAAGVDPRQRLAAEDQVLTAFADIAALFRPERHEGADAPEFLASSAEYFVEFLRARDGGDPEFPRPFLERLRRALTHYGLVDLERGPELDEALLHVYQARQRAEQLVSAIHALLSRRLDDLELLAAHVMPEQRELFDRLITTAERYPALRELVSEVRYRFFDQPLLDARKSAVYAEVEAHLAALADPHRADLEQHRDALVRCTEPLEGLFSERFESSEERLRWLMLEVLLRRYYRIRALDHVHGATQEGLCVARGEYELEGRKVEVLATCGRFSALADTALALSRLVSALPDGTEVVVDVHLLGGWPEASAGFDVAFAPLLHGLRGAGALRRLVISNVSRDRHAGGAHFVTFRRNGRGSYVEDPLYRGLHPMIAKRLQIERLGQFELARLPSAEDVYLFQAVAKANPKDERLFALCELRDLTPIRDRFDRIIGLPQLERLLHEAIAGMRAFQSRRRWEERLLSNRVQFDVWPAFTFSRAEAMELGRKLLPLVQGAGLEAVVLRARMPDAATGELKDTQLTLTDPGGAGLKVQLGPVELEPIRPLGEYEQKALRMRQRGLTYPYEIVALMSSTPEQRGALPPGRFVEHDLDAAGALVPVARAPGKNAANVVTGVIESFTELHPEGLKRVVVLGDPSREMGSIAEPECRRILGALALARRLGVPLEWFALSAGAKISMESGTENMDWVSRVLRGLIEHTQAGGEVNVVVTGINVGAQPYWNAEATMLMHTRGVLIMIEEAAMVLTGKTALDYSGSVSAEDNQGIGGYDRIMGPNGQAQYFAPNIPAACALLIRHYELCYRHPGERFPRRAPTRDRAERDVCESPHGGEDSFAKLGEIFSAATNPGRKRPFEIRRLMAAVADADAAPLERWSAMRDAEIAVVWDTRLGGHAVCMIGIESHPVARLGAVPLDGPDRWTPGTLFPQSSKKIARAINAASDNRPVVILANLSGFDGSPESMRRLQLEYGAEIGRAVVNFKGPIVFTVVSRYHGGAFVVFSKALNENLRALALEGSYASVIGGAPAAAVVFAREVEARARKDPALVALERRLAAAQNGARRELAAERDRLFEQLRSQKLGEVAAEFDQVHSVQRALKVGSLDAIIPARELRPRLISALDAGMARTTGEGR